MTPLRKPVYRLTDTLVRDRSTRRLLIAGLLPGDVIEVRLKGTRQRVSVPIEHVYYLGQRLLAAERAAEKRRRRLSAKA